MSTTLLIETRTHGRVIVEPSATPASAGILVGFHGYAETAEIQLERMAAIPGADAWTLLSVQGLHHFYRGRSEDVVSSWMTRQDRETAISDNLRYIGAALDAVGGNTEAIVYAGFSQGVAMAFRAALLGGRPCSGIVAAGGDVPPELLADATLKFPAVLLLRGARDEWYTEARFDADVSALRPRSANVQSITFDGAHEWSRDVGNAAGAFLGSLQRS